jgi:hypothetical protein
MKTNREILSEYLPEKAVSLALNLLEDSNVQLRITKSRSTKLGDYRPPLNRKYHRISVNHDLNKYHFLITLIHEFAHLKNWNLHQRKVRPHGKEWKTFFRELMAPYLVQEIFPPDILEVVIQFMKNPTSSVVNIKLLKKLREYDKGMTLITLDDIPENSKFSIYNGVIFTKLEKLKKRYKCLRLDTNRIYLVSPVMQVVPLIDN